MLWDDSKREIHTYVIIWMTVEQYVRDERQRSLESMKDIRKMIHGHSCLMQSELVYLAYIKFLDIIPQHFLSYAMEKDIHNRSDHETKVMIRE